MDLMKPLGMIATTTRDTVRHPVDTGLKAVGRTIGLVRGSASAVTGVLHRSDDGPAPRTGPAGSGAAPAGAGAPPVPPRPARITRTQPPGDLPTPADIADNVSPPGEVTTPAGTTGADVGHNPDTAETGLEQPGTEPLMDPSTTKAVASEADVLRRAADPDKG